MKFCSFDLETFKTVPNTYTIELSTGEELDPLFKTEAVEALASYQDWEIKHIKVAPDDFEKHWPLGISCAATICTGDEKPGLWYDENYGQMSQEACQSLVFYLKEKMEHGIVPLTFNGLGFDFRVLAAESGLWETCIELAMSHVDMMFHFFCCKGFSTSLDSALKGMALSGKTEGMSGGLAPVLWKMGRYQEVLDYVGDDVIGPLKLAEKVEQRHGLTWVTSKGVPSKYPVKISRWLTVREALGLPLPDTSWMDANQIRSRDEYMAWIFEADPNASCLETGQWAAFVQ